MTQASFADLGLAQPILDTLVTSGYTEPTPIQAAAIPMLLQRRDVMASAATGTGKTAAFMLPALNFLTNKSEKPGKGPRILVLSPTRELAAQIKTAAETYGKQIRHAKVVSVVGGMPYPLQIKLLSSPVEILVATPGRLIDLMDRGRIDLGRLEMLVLDEADRMLDLGFRDDIAHIATKLPQERVTALFSATLDGDIASIAQSLLNNPERIEIAPPPKRQEQIVEKLHYADDITHKAKLLDRILEDEAVGQAIIFIATKLDAADLSDRLLGQGKKAAALHGDMPQRERTRTLARLKKGEIDVLVATDVAARGIDVAGITHVVNFDLPKFAEDYVHRIGRTGRAGRDGIAISFAAKHEVPALRRIEKFVGRKLNPYQLEGLEARFEPRPSNGSRFGDKRDGGRKFGDRPRDGGKRFDERKPYGDKPQGDRKPFGERKSFGDRPAYAGDRDNAGNRGDNFGNREGSFSNRKPAGEGRSFDRKPYGDRDNRGNFADRDNRGNFADRDNRGNRGNFKGLESDSTVYAEQPRLTLHSPFENGNRKGGNRGQGSGNGNGNRGQGFSRGGGDNRGNVAPKRPGGRPSFGNRDFD
ncbi:DEAD/DEAH box helicase [Chitinimonas sp.]|uniref:DEAD/DEAH box helicase n=1 Tax=Chitinimonas sp. TaxID=1934313 RepID=UPI002F92CD95